MSTMVMAPVEPAKAELLALAYSTPEMQFADVVDDLSELVVQVFALSTDEPRPDGQRQLRGSARLVGRTPDGEVIERYGPIDVRRLAELLQR